MIVNFVTFGCKVNQYETENLKQLFKKNGFLISDDDKNCDVYVFNTCTVTSTSDKKNRQTIRRIRKANPTAIIVITGCFPQAFADEAEKLIEADIITGSNNKTIIPELVKEFMFTHSRIIKIDNNSKDKTFEKMQNTEPYEHNTRAFIKIQDGCDQFCSYCIIPTARGRIRSKSLEDLKEEVTALSLKGHKEIVLVGINLSCYGREFGKRLVDAIEVCCAVNGIERVRLGSLEPELILDEDIERMKAQPKLCPQFHLSIQSGCDKTLKEMNRKYNTHEFYEIVTKLRNAFEDCAITTDIMVGFPGESDDDFNESLEFVKKVGFSQAHIFPYSKREGTVASKRPDQILNSIKEKRAKEMKKITDISARIFLENQMQKVFPVLFEKPNCDDFHQGYSPNYTLIKIPAQKCDKSLKNQIHYVKINSIENNQCIGEIIK